MSLEVAMRWYWRVRYWSMRFGFSMASIEGTDRVGNDATLMATGIATTNRHLVYNQRPNAGDFSVDQIVSYNGTEFYLSSACAVTQDFADGSGFYTGTSEYTPPDDRLFDDGIQVSGGCGFTMFDAALDTDGNPTQDPMVYCIADGLYYPRIALAGFVVSQRREASIAATLSLSGFSSNHRTQKIAFVFDGVAVADLDGFYTWGMDGGSGIMLTSAAKPSISISPSQYWEYQDASGQPRFDASTGNPVINPATGVPYTREEIIASPWP